MILLDTNVISEMMRPNGNSVVVGWVAQQERDALYTSSVNKAEILYGIRRLPEGRRRAALVAAAATMFDEEFVGRVLPFDESGAIHFADIMVARHRSGKPIAVLDALIAGVARAAGAAVATRDIGGFEGCGVALVDPWTAK